MPDTRSLYYCFFVATNAARHRGSSLMCSRTFDAPSEAKQHGASLIAAGDASLTFVVEVHDNKWIVLETYTRPTSAARVIRHFLDLDEELDRKEHLR